MSTFAECAAHNRKRVNKDLLREMLHGRWPQQPEKDVIAAQVARLPHPELPAMGHLLIAGIAPRMM
jgi:hypothetical protein